MKKTLALLIFISLIGCATTHTPKYPLLKSDKALIVFYRPTSYLPATAISLPIYDGEKKIRSIMSGTYFFYECEPGEHTFWCQGTMNKAKAFITIVPQKRYYIKHGLTYGAIGGNAYIERVPDSEGDADIRKLKNIDDVKFHSDELAF